ncbi:hypothetical protein FF38_09680 [Lucilia cuprina]|uniref:Uncharacterized protein n=1 Tax=Lucilia cuprina TaxID=7375 RepID=A0A0L0C9J5_LUCCU|nr:hypothetical protein FF38_09680 [Lucilia cuprina]
MQQGLYEGYVQMEEYCKDHKYRYPMFKRVCTDVSSALYGGVLRSFNRQHISDKTKTNEFKESFAVIKQNVVKINESELEKHITFEEEDFNNLESIAARSPFRKVFEQIWNNVYDNLKPESAITDINEYNNEEICTFIVKKYCAFLPMWTNIMGILIDPSGDHISNAPAEYTFYLQKHIFLDDKSLRPWDFIKIDRKDAASSLKELRYKYNMFDVQQKDAPKSTILERKRKEDVLKHDVNRKYECDILQDKKEKQIETEQEYCISRKHIDEQKKNELKVSDISQIEALQEQIDEIRETEIEVCDISQVETVEKYFESLPLWSDCEAMLNKRYQHISADESSGAKPKIYKNTN